ncbi:hypothetical protein BDV93DRAFT_609062 [Ceratobasidium sp. AG-I]|nr:hypothetical protein BDV93DRAFT_609062 [Ceratobasidium sp. AG-I]
MSMNQDSNNQNRVSTPDTAHTTNVPAESYTRDPQYYYDHSVVLMVEGVLFKLPKTLLLSHMTEIPHPPAKITRSVIEHSDKGTSDSDPFVISGVTTQQFRWFLLLLLGTPIDPEYRSLFMSAQGTANPTKDIFLCYLGAYAITRYFGMTELREWSYSQLEIVLESVSSFVNSSWDKDTIIQAMSCAQPMDCRNSYNLYTFVSLALSTEARSSTLAYESPLLSNLDTCVALYKDCSLPQTYPSLFGYVFSVILSLGHRSPIWINQLTREDRNVLYAAQAHLVFIGSDPDLGFSWLWQPLILNRCGYCSDSCTEDAETAWSASFARCGDFHSKIPLEDISNLLLLPSYRQLFADATQSRFNSCRRECARRMLGSIDETVEAVFAAMCRKHKYFVENA